MTAKLRPYYEYKTYKKKYEEYSDCKLKSDLHKLVYCMETGRVIEVGKQLRLIKVKPNTKTEFRKRCKVSYENEGGGSTNLDKYNTKAFGCDSYNTDESALRCLFL